MTRDHDPVLERVSRQLPEEPDAFERLRERREAKIQRKRAGAGAVALGLTAALIGGLAWSSARSDGSDGDRVQVRGSTVPLVAGPGEYYYQRGTSYDAASGRATDVEIWAGPDDSGRLVWSGGQVQPDDQRFGAGEFPGEFLPGLSDDPGTLLEQLVRRGSESGASPAMIATTSPGRSQETTSLLRTLQDLLTYGSDAFLTPTQVATVAEATSTIDDVTTEPGVIDPLGRPATRLSFVIDYNIAPGSTVEWYFDPDTGQFMGELWRNAKTGAIESATIIEVAGISTSLDEPPAHDARYVHAGDPLPVSLAALNATVGESSSSS